MDVRLQRLVAFRQHGETKPATATTAADEVAVIAKVSDLAAFEEMSEVNMGVVVGETAGDGTHDPHRARARGPAGAHPPAALRGQSQVGPAPFTPTHRHHHRCPGTPQRSARSRIAAGGAGVVVGIVDIGCDFAHRNFLNSSGGTRLRKLWDQNGSGQGEGAFDYGTIFRPDAINAALRKPDPYEALGYGPEPAQPRTAPTSWTSRPATGGGTGNPGVAPRGGPHLRGRRQQRHPVERGGRGRAELRRLGPAVGGAGVRLPRGRGRQPCVINVSLGTNGGPHDGSTLVEQGIDRLLDAAPNRGVCIAASNSFADGIHSAATVPASGSFDLDLAHGPRRPDSERAGAVVPGLGRPAHRADRPRRPQRRHRWSRARAAPCHRPGR